MTLAHLRRGDAIALIAALALLLVMPMTWFTTKVGEELRHESTQFIPSINNDLTPSPSSQASQAAALQEHNAYRPTGTVDRLLLIALIAAAALALTAVLIRALGRRFEPPLTPSALTAGAGLVACVLLAYRILRPPGLQSAAVVKPAAVLALVCVGVLTIGARVAMRQEAAEAETSAEPTPAESPAAGTPDAVA